MLLVLLLSFTFIIQAGTALAGKNSTELDQIDIDGDGEMEIIVKDPYIPPTKSYLVDLDGDGDPDIVVVGTDTPPPNKK